MARLRWLAFGLLLLPGLAWAQVPVKVGSFPGYGRIVFEFTRATGFEVAETEERAQVVFTGAPALGAAKGTPRNVRAIERAAGSVTLVLVPGARVRSARQGNRVVIDVLDPVPGRPARGPAQAAHAPEPAKSQSDLREAATPPPAPAAPTVAAAPAAPATPAMPPEPPRPAPPRPAPPPSVPARPASILVPLEAGVGAAAFRRAENGMVVFDGRVPLDLAALGGGPAFAAASVRLGQASTVLSVPLSASQGLALSREPGGWRVALADDAAPPVPIGAEPGPGGLLLVLDNPSQVVTVADPATGLALLVGTVNPAVGAGPGLAPARRTPGYALAPTWLGVAVEPLSDLIELRPAARGFALVSPGLPGVSAPAQPPEAFTRRFDLPDLPMAALTQRLAAQQAAAAAAPPRARTGSRMAVAQSLLCLGMATEAQAVLALVATEDPIAAADPKLVGLMGVAALLAGRSPEATGLDDPRLDGADDVALWRGVRDAIRDDAEAGRGLARLLPLADGYPAALRDRLRPLMVEAAVSTGQGTTVAGALAKADDHTLDFARALQRERDGDAAEALKAFDALAAGRDQLMQVRAGVRAAELRLKGGALTPAQAADVLERQAAAWRGDARESRMRLRAAELRAVAGSFRPALEMLRDTERLFPGQQPAIRAAMAGVVRAMLAQPQAVEPLELVTLVSDYAGMLPAGAGEGLSALLADKLVALDLPGRAAPVLASLMAAAPAGPARAGIGARLAQVQLENAAAPAAEAALRASDAPGLPAPLAEQRTLALARARAAQGDVGGATAALQALGTPAADDLRATLLGQASDWPGSLAALSDLSAKTVPADGALADGMQDTVLRQATAAARAHDAAALAELSRRYGARLAGPRADLFRVLTAAPLQSPSDLPRAAAELALARTLPDRLHGLSAQNTK